MNKSLKVFLLSCGLIISAVSQAAVIQYSSNFSSNNISNYDSTYGSSFGDQYTVNRNIYLNRFDASLGDLTGVQISFTSNWNHRSYANAYDSSAEYTTRRSSYSCGVFNSSTCYRYYKDYYNDARVNMNSTANFRVELLDPSFSQMNYTDYNFDACSRNISYQGSTGCADGTYNSYNIFNGSLNLSSISLSAFTGINDLRLNFRNFASMYGTCDNNDYGDRCYGYNDAYWNGAVTVAYTYTKNVSAPGALLLLCGSLFGLHLFRKRKK